MRNKIFLGFILSLIIIDQITKGFFSSRDFYFLSMHFHPVKNYGLSFALDFGTTINTILVIIAFVLFGFYLWHSYKKHNYSRFGAVLVLAGAVSNICDRIYFGYVRDFWDIGLGFTFNLADLFIVLGIIIMLTSSNSEQVVE